MTEFNEILNLLEAERERYVLEAGRLERRLESIRIQVTAIDNLISGYIQEKQSDLFYQHFIESQTQAYLEEDKSYSKVTSEENIVENIEKPQISLQREDITEVENHQEQHLKTKKIDISDIPKVKGGRQSETLPMVPEYQGYSIKNAILILMRRQPDYHFHTSVILRTLYGDNIAGKQKQTARVNITKALSVGSKDGIWFKVLRHRGVYTLKYKKGVTAKIPKAK